MLQSIATEIEQPFIALFDPIVQNDGFGKAMIHNLTKAKIVSNPSMSLLTTRTLQCQIEKLYSAGFRTVTGCDFLTCFNNTLRGEDRKRANAVEMLDEVEEWELIMRHYCFVVGSKTSNGTIMEKFCAVDERSVLGFKSGRCTTTLCTHKK